MIDYLQEVFILENRYKSYKEITTLDDIIDKDYEIVFPALAGEQPRLQK
jgi:hypothetical protein